MHRFDKKFRGDYCFHPEAEEIERYFETIPTVPKEILPQLKSYHALQGCLFGTAVGDAIGLPYEGLSPRRIRKLKVFPLKHRFFFGRGMLSDDTEHTCMVADSLIYSQAESEKFSKLLACTMRLWFLGLPAGIGMATLRSCVKLWLFIPANKSGVFSAGNGPAMRSAIVGVYASDNETLRRELITINTRITHTDPKAIKGAMIVAELAARNTEGNSLNPDNCLAALSTIIDDDRELEALVTKAINSARVKQSAEEFCAQENQVKGVSGYIYHTLPVVIQIVLRHNQNYEEAISEAIRCGGDTDTVAAIIGGIVGANVGKKGIPEDWLENLRDWPRDKTYLHLLGEELTAVKYLKKKGRAQWMDFVRLLLRNAFFMIWVLAHGFRRLLPPY
ncbi:MAG: ADP-ribosylglycohydrolase family protein [Gammaproteobacteria bacterium]|nr:ADP-ribosylglycohydrolase family protein [Gammaproteobacteria bacterium]